MSKRFKKIYVEIGNSCNFQCSFCPPVERAKHLMDPLHFQEILKEAAPLTEEVCFHLMGEPLSHPHFEEYLELCSEMGVRVNLTTNGSLLNEKLGQALLNPIISQINFSAHSFEANFPTGNIRGYLTKLFDFIELTLTRRPEVYINLRLWNLQNPEGSLQESQTNTIVLETVEERFDFSLEKKPDIRRKKGLRVQGRFYLHFDSEFQWPHPSMPFRTAKGYCHGLSSHIGILADGTVVPCCLDKEGRLALGKCGTQSLTNILAGEKAVRMAQGFAKGELTEDLCQKCTFVSRFDKKAIRLRQREHGERRRDPEGPGETAQHAFSVHPLS